MTNALEHIDSYFQGGMTPEEKRRFEQAILDDPEFAKQVAFYVSSIGILKQGARSSVLDVVPELSAEELSLKKSRFRELYEQEKKNSEDSDLADNVRPISLFGQGNFGKTGIGELVAEDDAETAVRAHAQNTGATIAPVRSMWRKWGMVAAACVVTLVVMTVFWFNGGNSHMQLADSFIKEDLAVIGVAMSTTSDSVSMAKEKYNAGDFSGSLMIFEKMANGSDAKLTEFAGLAALRAGSYDKALQYFTDLSKVEDHISNPGDFYLAVTLMKQNKPGNEEKAKKLLEQVVANNLGHSNEAKHWLENW